MMKQRRILIVDSDQKNLKVLELNFQASSYSVATALSNEEAIHRLNSTTFDVLLTEVSSANINGFQLLKEVQRNPNHHVTSVIFLSIKSDVWNRVKSLKLGAKDYIVKPIHVNEIIARVNMVQNRIDASREQQADNSNSFNGRLEDLAVIDLIEVLGTERKTGILSLNNENGHSGQIIFNRGSVISATAEILRAEEAIYKMIYWNRGRFSMLFTDVSAEDEFTLSNLGLLLQGAKRMDLRNELLKQLPSLDAIIITTSNFKKIISQKDINAELREFMKLFDGERTLGRIIDDSHENEIVTLKRIVKLYKLGFLHVLRNFSSEQPIQFKSSYEDEFNEYGPAREEPEFDEDVEEADDMDMDFETEIDRVVPDNFPTSKDRLAQTKKEPIKNAPAVTDADSITLSESATPPQEGSDHYILLISSDELNSRLFMGSLLSEESEELNIRGLDSPIYTGYVQLRGGSKLRLMSVKPDEHFLMLLEYFREKAFGCIFLMDIDHINWSYQRYLFKTISEQLNVPTLVAAKYGRSSDFESQIIREKTELAEEYTLRFLANFETDTCRRILFTLVNEAQGDTHVFTIHSERIATK